jgi:hypothetical protein
VAGDHHSELDGAGDPHGHQTAIEQLPPRTCTHGASTLGAVAGTVGAESLVMASGAGCWSVRSVRDCCCGKGSVRCRGALGKRPRWAVTGCLSAVPARGGCVMIARGLRGHWPAAVTAGHCCVDQ